MSNKPISDLRRRMIEDMTVRSFSDNTKNDYIRHVETLAAFLGRSPDTVTGDDLRQFQLHQVQQGAQPSKLNSQASGLRFFFTITLGRADLTHQLARTHYPRKLPRVLSPDEVARLLEAAPGQCQRNLRLSAWPQLRSVPDMSSQPVPLFQNLARDYPSCGDAICSVSAVASQC